MIHFREATIDDALAILSNLREHEARTVEKLAINAQELLIKALSGDFVTWVCLIDETPAAIFGATSDTILGEPRLWMLTTPLIERHQVPLLRASKLYVKSMSERFGSIVGMVDSEFETSRRWLRWIGFKEVQDGDYIVMRYHNGH